MIKIPKGSGVRVVLILLFVVLLFSGCIGQEKEAETKTSPPEVETSTETTVETKVQTESDEFAEARRKMVMLMEAREIIDLRVLEVMGRIPRHLFVDEELWDRAYQDYPLPIAEGQTISQPYVVAMMTQALQLNGSERVLEIGTGSGYQAAVLAELCQEVYTIEIREKLAKSAAERLQNLGYKNVDVKWADGYFGWEEHAPYDRIIITCAVNHIPPNLLQQLKDDGGLLILPLGSPQYIQNLTLVQKQGDDIFTTYISSVRFVPMIGEAEKGGD